MLIQLESKHTLQNNEVKSTKKGPQYLFLNLNNELQQTMAKCT